MICEQRKIVTIGKGVVPFFLFLRNIQVFKITCSKVQRAVIVTLTLPMAWASHFKVLY